MESDFKSLSWSQRASPASGVKCGLSGRVTPAPSGQSPGPALPGRSAHMQAMCAVCEALVSRTKTASTLSYLEEYKGVQGVSSPYTQHQKKSCPTIKEKRRSDLYQEVLQYVNDQLWRRHDEQLLSNLLLMDIGI